MDAQIVDTINMRAANHLATLSDTSKTLFVTTAYAGIQVLFNGYSLKRMATELGYSTQTVSQFVSNWERLLKEGDMVANMVSLPFGQFGKSTIEGDSKSHKDVLAYRKAYADFICKINKCCKEHVTARKVLGFSITPEDELREREVIRLSIRFMRNYGKGHQPNDGDVTYITYPEDDNAENGFWIPLHWAARYCGCSHDIIQDAATFGLIARRLYKRTVEGGFYEYNVSDLDQFIKLFGLT